MSNFRCSPEVKTETEPKPLVLAIFLPPQRSIQFDFLVSGSVLVIPKA